MNFGFEWTNDWYSFDDAAAHQAAKAARDAMAKELRAAGHKVSRFQMNNQLVSRGGCGSGRPHIELIVTAYGINY